MKLKSLNKTIFLPTLFASALISASASAQIIPDGDYTIAINPTPNLLPGFPFFIPNVGTDGAWNSSFTFNSLPSFYSQPLTDNDILINTMNGPKGSSIGGDEYAGTIGITVASNVFSSFYFQLDTIQNTAGGNVAFSGPQAGMTGTIDQVTGQMTFTPNGRVASVDGIVPYPTDNIFNIPPGATDWASFTTGATTNGNGTINGTPIANLGDINGDGLDDFSATLVSGSIIGNAWPGFTGANYFEVWNVTIFSGTNLVVIPPPSVNISVTGGNTQECNEIGGNQISVSAIVSPADTSLASINWELNGNVVASGNSASLFVPVGSHMLGVSIETNDGQTAFSSQPIVVEDTTAPVLDVALVDSRSGEPVSVIDRPNVSWVKAQYSATDICDDSPSTSGFGGFAVANGDSLKVQGNLNAVTLTTSIIELSASTEDNSGNTASGKATLNIID